MSGTKNDKGNILITCGHEDKKHQAFGMCINCYSKHYRILNRKKLIEKDQARKARQQTPEHKLQKYKALIKRKYNLSFEYYTEILEKQQGLCKICEQPPNKNKKLHVDHCHKTGKVRGLLCAQCNWYMGKLDNNPSVIWNLLSYGNENNCEW